MRRLLSPVLLLYLLVALPISGCFRLSQITTPWGSSNPPPSPSPAAPGAPRRTDRPGRALAADPVLARFQQADGLLLQGKAPAAADLLLQLAAAAPDRWYIWNTLSLAYRRLDYLPAAAAAGVRANYLKPGDPTVAFNTGVALTMAGRAAEAVPLLRAAGGSADALYWLAIAQTAAISGPSPEARQTLQHLLERYPNDKESRVALAAQDSDLDMDQAVDSISMNPGRLTVHLSSAAEPFELTWNPLAAPVPTAFQVVDARAPYPVLLLWSDSCVWIYQYTPEIHTLKQAAQIFGAGTWHFGTKVLSMGRFDSAMGQTTAEDWAWGESGWQMLRHFASGSTTERAVPPPRSPLDLGAQLSEYPVRTLFAGDKTWESYTNRWRSDIAGQGAQVGVFLLPAGAGAPAVGAGAPVESGWQVEIWSDGQVLDRFAVNLTQTDGVFMIAGLRPEP